MAGFAVFASIMHLASIAVTIRRLLGKITPYKTAVKVPPVSILRPLCGLENHLEETLRSGFELQYPDFELLFCVTSPTDPVIGLVEDLIAQYPDVDARLLVGDDQVSGNPKLNNLVKGWREARSYWIVMSDSNVLLPRDYIDALLSRWTVDTGLVSSPPVGVRPEGFAAVLECAFLNTYQARWQLASDHVGMGFAQGKTLFWRRDIFEQNGGFSALAGELAEDVASTKLVHRSGLKVRLAQKPFPQLIGRRRFVDVLERQKRWARLRRMGFFWEFLGEFFSGLLTPLFAVVLIVTGGLVPVWILPVFLLFWYGSEWLLAKLAGWPSGFWDVGSWGLRDILLPFIWLSGWKRDPVVWRGNDVVDGNSLKTEAAGSTK